MSKIWLKEFGGMVPRIGEQHLSAQRRIAETGYFPGRGQAKDREIMSWPHATEAENCHLFSGELRPLKQPQLTHTFCRPDEECWRAPIPVDPSIPPPEPPEPPPGCVPVVITQQLPLSDICKEYACDALTLGLQGVGFTDIWRTDTLTFPIAPEVGSLNLVDRFAGGLLINDPGGTFASYPAFCTVPYVGYTSGRLSTDVPDAVNPGSGPFSGSASVVWYPRLANNAVGVIEVQIAGRISIANPSYIQAFLIYNYPDSFSVQVKAGSSQWSSAPIPFTVEDLSAHIYTLVWDFDVAQTGGDWFTPNPVGVLTATAYVDDQLIGTATSSADPFNGYGWYFTNSFPDKWVGFHSHGYMGLGAYTEKQLIYADVVQIYEAFQRNFTNYVDPDCA